MLIASTHGLRYCRLLTDRLTAAEGGRLASEFDYAFAVCYQGCDAPMFERIEKNACLIDLTQDIESILSKFNATHRSQVKKSWQIEGLEFSSNTEPFHQYFDFHRQCETDRNWLPIPEEELLNSLCISATYKGQWVAGMSCYLHGPKMRIGRIYSTRRSVQFGNLTNNIYGCASKRIVYEYCKWGCENGFENLDLGGIDFNDPNKAGLKEFKTHFGPTIVPVTIARFASERFRQQSNEIRNSGYDLT
jgi:hypothetical protein